MDGEAVAGLAAGRLNGSSALPIRQRTLLLGAVGTPIFLYLLAAPYGGLIYLPTNFLLKNGLHLSASATAVFGLIAAIPLFLGLAFGLIRDRWSPWKAGDRGHLILFGVLAAVVYAAMALAPVAYGVLLAGVVAATACAQFVTSAAQGLATTISRRYAITGQASTTINMVTYAATVIAVLLGGRLALHVAEDGGARDLFLLGGGLFLVIALFGAFGPRALFAESHAADAPASTFGELRRLLATRAIYPALLIQLLWQFAPGFGVALQYHLVNDIHASADQVGLFYAFAYGSFLPVFALYGWLARRVSLRALIWGGTIIAVPSMLTLLFVHTPGQAMWAGALICAVSGIGQAAYFDLAMRSAPKGLEGSMMMLLLTMYWLAVRGGDVWGAYLFDHQGGFDTTLWASTAVYAAIIPMLLLIPKRLTATHDA